ncbi:hypothetical protein BD770DRAFT_413179 [Pilaira anomala]|nr:hypothetical protein BD770DRAFT_413179 [Pilaira anomala]
MYIQLQRRKKKLDYLKVTRSATLFRWNSQLWSSSLCRICKSESETIQHFFVSCFHKWSFWESQLAGLQLTAKFPTPEPVWLSIYTLHDESAIYRFNAYEEKDLDSNRRHHVKVELRASHFHSSTPAMGNFNPREANQKSSINHQNYNLLQVRDGFFSFVVDWVLGLYVDVVDINVVDINVMDMDVVDMD